MKKRIGIAALCTLIAITAFAFTACGLSGVGVDKNTFNNAIDNYKAAFSSKTVKVEYTYRSTGVSTSELVSAGSKRTVTKQTANSERTYVATYDGNSAHIKNVSISETKVNTGSNNKVEVENETYYVVTGDFVYTIEKGMDGNWLATKKTSLPNGNTLAEYTLNYFSTYAFEPYNHGTNFDDYEYSGGRYYLKQSVIDSGKSQNTEPYIYDYGNIYSYVVFNAEGLYTGSEHYFDCTTKMKFSDSNSANLGIATSKTSYTEQSKVTYSGKVVVPDYTNDLD